MQNKFETLFYFIAQKSRLILSHQAFVLMKTSFAFVFRILLQGVLIKTKIFTLVLRLQKTSSRRLAQGQYIRLGHTSSRRFEDVFKTSWRCFRKTSSRRFEDVFKTSSRHLPDVLKTSSRRLAKSSSRHLQDVLQRYLQDVFSTYHQAKLFLSTRLRDLFNTFLRRTAKTVTYRRICLGHTSEKYMVGVQNLQEW